MRRTLTVGLKAVLAACLAPSLLSFSSRAELPAPLVLHYTFDADSGTNVTDQSGQGNGGYCVGAVQHSEGRSGLGARFTSRDTYIVSKAPALNMNGWTGCTVALWAKVNSRTAYGTVLGRGQEVGPGYAGVHLQLSGSYDGVRMEVATNLTGGRVDAAYAPRPTLGVWNHYACVYTGRALFLYQNGQLVGSNLLSVSSPVPLADLADGRLVLGNMSATPYIDWTDMYFNGVIDEVKVFSRALAPDEVTGLCSSDDGAVELAIAGSPGRYGMPGPLAYGTNRIEIGRTVTNSVESPVVDGGGARRWCMGWTGSGSVPASGTDTQCVFTITNASCLTWRWESDFRLTVGSGVGGTVEGASEWYSEGEEASIRAVGVTGYEFLGWTGDVPAGRETMNPLSLPMDRPRSVYAVFTSGDPLVLHYTFDEDSGTNVVDSSGMGNDGYLVGGVQHVDGRTGSGVGFTSRDTYIVSRSQALNMNGWTGCTVALWAKVNGRTAYGTVLGRGQETGPGYAGLHFQLSGDPTYPGVRMEVATNLTGGRIDVAYEPKPALAVWNHYAFVYTGRRMILYQNGMEVASEDVPGNGVAPIADSGGYRLVLGNMSATPLIDWFDMFFNGTVDDLRVYRAALTSSEVRELSGVDSLHALTVRTEGYGRVDGGAGGLYPDGAHVALTAVPLGRYVFSHWTGDVEVSERELNPLTVVMAADRVVVAVFTNSGLAESGPILHYTFDTDAGTNVFDSSSSSNHGYTVGQVQHVGGWAGQGAQFTSRDTYIVSKAGALNMNGWTGCTVALWAKVNGRTTYGNVLGRGQEIGPKYAGLHFQLSGHSSYQGVRMEIATNTIGGRIDVGYDAKPEIGVWNHFACVYSGRDLRIYQNGVLMCSRDIPAQTAVPIADVADSRFVLGNMSSTPLIDWSDMFFNGIVDDLRIYDRALGPDEVTEVYGVGTARLLAVRTDGGGMVEGATNGWYANGAGVAFTAVPLGGYGFSKWTGDVPGGETAQNPLTLVMDRDRVVTAVFTNGTGLLLYYPFDGDESTNVTDWSGNGLSGLSLSGAVHTVGLHGQAMAFDGVSSYVASPTDPMLSLHLSDARSFSFWWKADHLAADSGHFLLSKRAASEGNRGLSFLVQNGRQYYMALGIDHWATWTAPVTTGAWTHVVLTKNGSTWRLYHQGVELPVSSSMGWPFEADIHRDVPLWIGSDQVGFEKSFDGQVDEFRIYDRTLTGSEASRLFSVRPPDAPTGVVARAGAAGVVLDWLPSEAPNLLGYHIYRADTAGGPFDRLTSSPAAGTSFEDYGASPAHPCFYYVTAVAGIVAPYCVLESGPSAVVSALAQRVRLWMPDFSGNTGTIVRLAVNVDNARGLAGSNLLIAVSYDPSLLVPLAQAIPGEATLERAVLATNWTLVDNGATATGRLEVAGTAGGGLTGEGRLFDIRFSVAAGAPLFATAVSRFLEAKLFAASGVEVQADASDTALFTVDPRYRLGDVNGDGYLTVDGDFTLAMKLAVGQREPTPQELAAGDINGNGVIDKDDAHLILRMIRGKSINPDGSDKTADGGYLLSEGTGLSEGGAATLSVGTGSAAPGSIVQLPISIDDATGLASAEFQVNYDPASLTFLTCTNGALTEAFFLESHVAGGSVRVALSTDEALTSGGGSVVLLTFAVRPVAEIGAFLPLALANMRLGGLYGADMAWSRTLVAVDGGLWVVLGRTADRDGDGISDYDEQMYNGSPDYDPYTPGTPSGTDLDVESGDTDTDGMKDAAELTAGTDPLDPGSVLAVTFVTEDMWGRRIVCWRSVSGRTYSVLQASLADGPYVPVVTGVPGTPPINVVESLTPAEGVRFYRVLVETP